MEFEAFLLGLEPIAAGVVGLGILAIAPIFSAVDSATNHKLSESTRETAKTGLVWAFQAIEQAQSTFAEAGESFQDLVAEAKSDLNSSRNGNIDSSPREVTIG
jgi:hypothetical protein